MFLCKGQKIHIDTDNKEWGRVCSNARVIEDIDLHNVLVEVFSIRANIIVPKKDCFARDDKEYLKEAYGITD